MNATPWVLFGTLIAILPGDSAQPPKGAVAQEPPKGAGAPDPPKGAVPQEPQAAPEPADHAEDEKAIRAAVDVFLDAFAKGDAAAIARMFTEEGEAIDTEGEAIRGREALEGHYAERFETNPGDKLEATIDLIHFLTPELVRQDGQTRLIPPDDGLATTSRYTATLIKIGQGWQIASVRELDEPTITHHDQLKELEWMIGDWVEETGDAVINTSIQWSEDENFLLRTYEIQVDGQPDLKGTQRIGWDPLTNQIKSWVFDSRGGYGDGYWTWSEDQWIIKSVGVRPDGLTTSATQTLTRINKDRLHWSSKDRTLGGETRTDIHDFFMVRKPPEPK